MQQVTFENEEEMRNAINSVKFRNFHEHSSHDVIDHTTYWQDTRYAMKLVWNSLLKRSKGQQLMLWRSFIINFHLYAISKGSIENPTSYLSYSPVYGAVIAEGFHCMSELRHCMIRGNPSFGRGQTATLLALYRSLMLVTTKAQLIQRRWSGHFPPAPTAFVRELIWLEEDVTTCPDFFDFCDLYAIN